MFTINASRSITIFFRILILSVGAAQCWRYRFTISSMDMISYLDMAVAFSKGEWWEFINGYWNPAYPALLGIAKWMTRIGVDNDYVLARFVNWLILVFALLSFEHLINYFIKQKAPDDASTRYSSEVILVGGYVIFLWCILKWLPAHFVGADFLLAAIFFRIAESIFRLQRVNVPTTRS